MYQYLVIIIIKSNQMNEFQRSLAMMESFFRIHFSKNEEILEDLLPVLKKIDPNSSIPNSVKRVLEESGPCICLLNRLIFENRNHYKPSDPKIKSRAQELEELYDILVEARKSLQTELEFQSLVAAIISFHKRETSYPQLFSFFLKLTNNQNLLKNLLKYLDDKAIHSLLPYIPNEDSDSDFSFDEISDIDPDLQPRMRINESVSEILSKCDEKSDIALNLFLNGIIDREDLLLVSPIFEHSKIFPDPVAIDSHNFVTESLKNGEKRANNETFPHVQHSYRNSHHFAPVLPFSGASSSEEFALNRRYISTFIPLKENEKFKAAINVDAEFSSYSIFQGCQILHDQEIESDVLYNATTDIIMKHIHPGLSLSLTNIYGYQSDNVIDFLKSAYDQAKPVVIRRMLDSLVKLARNYYKSYSDCYTRLSKEAFRSFPHPEHISECMNFFREKIGPEKSSIADYITSLFNNIDSNETFDMSFWQTNIVTKFCVLYKFFLRKYKNYDYFKPVLPLVDASSPWYLVYEDLIEDGIRSLQLSEFDNEEFKYQTEFITKGIDGIIESISKDFNENNFSNGNVNPDLLNVNIKKVRFEHCIHFTVPILKLIILPGERVDIGITD